MTDYSVLNGTDVEAIQLLLKVHCSKDAPKILDCTYNTGKMWRGSPHKPVRMDIDPSYELDVVSDFKSMPFADASFDVIVFDPPHMPKHAASPNSSRIYEGQYGITDTGWGRDGDNISDLFPPFLLEAKRVLVQNGLILAKIADIIHNHRYQWHHLDFCNAVFAAGMTACDLLVKIDPRGGNLKSSKWKNVMHLRKKHSYWIVCRNSKRCEKSSSASN